MIFTIVLKTINQHSFLCFPEVLLLLNQHIFNAFLFMLEYFF